jgi:hypothetical protein
MHLNPSSTHFKYFADMELQLVLMNNITAFLAIIYRKPTICATSFYRPGTSGLATC